MKTIQMTFYSEATTATIDRDRGVIKGVSIITEGVAKGHGMIVDMETLRQVKKCIEDFGEEGIKVKVNHYTGFEAIIGTIRGCYIEGNQLKGDLHMVQSHEMFESVMELAEKQPSTFGLSISFTGDIEEIAGLPYARCREIYSVDLVDSPAANPGGLFSVPRNKDLTTATKGTNKDNDMTVTESVTEAISKALGLRQKQDEIDSEIKNLRDATSDLGAKLASTELALKSAQSEVAARDETIKTLRLEIATAKAAVTSFEEKVEKAAAAKALAITQAIGQDPSAAPPVKDPNNPPNPITGLKGLEKVRAAFDAQLRADGYQA